MQPQIVSSEEIAAAPITTTKPASDALPLIVAFPHSGDWYPTDFGYRPALSYGEIDYPSDKYVDELFSAATGLGLATIRANFPRAYIDVNRHQHDIDGEMLEDPALWYGRLQPTAKVDGSTLFWSQAKAVPIYDRKLSLREAKSRIATCFVPYHQTLTCMIEEARRRAGRVCLLDCHSMMQFDHEGRGGRARPQIDIGTRQGQSCDVRLAEALAASLEERGYEVGLNSRFSGGEVTLRYGWPEIGQHALQIELRRDLYMNEETRQRSERFEQMQSDCTAALQKLMQTLASLDKASGNN